MAALCESGRLLFLPAIAPVNTEGAVVSPGDVRAQTRFIFSALREHLAESGGSLADLVKLTTWLVSMDDFPTSRQVRDEFISGPAPPATLLEIPALFHPGQRIQIEAVALID
jgi:enamine deaminase RidA (YjgF/YER057c/UK114 family)